MLKLAGNAILIIGASKGIGLGRALICLRHGAKVALIARDPEAAKAEITAAGFSFDQDVLALSTDVREAVAMEAAIAKTVEQFGRLDGLVNNAGWHPLGRMATTEEIGEVCAFLLSPEAAFFTGQTICPDGGAALGYRR